MGRPKKWEKWKNNPIESVKDNVEFFNSFFLDYNICESKTPKAYALFNLWIKEGFLETEEKLCEYKRKSKNGKFHKSQRWRTVGKVSLKVYFRYLKNINIKLSPLLEKILIELFKSDTLRKVALSKTNNALTAISYFVDFVSLAPAAIHEPTLGEIGIDTPYFRSRQDFKKGDFVGYVRELVKIIEKENLLRDYEKYYIYALLLQSFMDLGYAELEIRSFFKKSSTLIGDFRFVEGASWIWERSSDLPNQLTKKHWDTSQLLVEKFHLCSPI
jgi:hypothetical protein